MRKQKISDKQKRFAQEYIIDSNATQAAIRAGYARVSANVSGHNCITNYNVKQEIERLQTELAIKTGFTVDEAQKMYLEDRNFARKCRQAGAATSATTGICRLYGMDKDSGGGREQTIIIIGPKQPVKAIESVPVASDKLIEGEHE